MAYLHDNMITHNDIKPANVLLRDDDTPVLVDFGFATVRALYSAASCCMSASVPDPFS